MQFHAFVLLLLLYLTTAARVQFCHTNPSKSIDLCLALASVRSQSTTTTITSIDADGTIGSGSSKSSSNQDVYMHISSRFVGRRGWAAFGTGTIMHGSLMIVVYPGENEGGMLHQLILLCTGQMCSTSVHEI